MLRDFPLFPAQYISAYKSWDDLYELRIVCSNVQYRPFGFYGPMRGQFSLVVGGIEKGKLPRSLLKVAQERMQTVRLDMTRVKPHDFS